MQEYVITGKPITKKNSIRLLGLGRKCKLCGKNQKIIPAPSKAYKDYERDAVRQLMAQKAPGMEPISTAVNVRCIYYMPTHALCDLVNLLESTCDILVKARFLEDDNYKIIAGHDGSCVRYDKNLPRVVITIEE